MPDNILDVFSPEDLENIQLSDEPVTNTEVKPKPINNTEYTNKPVVGAFSLADVADVDIKISKSTTIKNPKQNFFSGVFSKIKEGWKPIANQCVSYAMGTALENGATNIKQVGVNGKGVPQYNAIINGEPVALASYMKKNAPVVTDTNNLRDGDIVLFMDDGATKRGFTHMGLVYTGKDGKKHVNENITTKTDVYASNTRTIDGAADGRTIKYFRPTYNQNTLNNKQSIVSNQKPVISNDKLFNTFADLQKKYDMSNLNRQQRYRVAQQMYNSNNDFRHAGISLNQLTNKLNDWQYQYKKNNPQETQQQLSKIPEKEMSRTESAFFSSPVSTNKVRKQIDLKLSYMDKKDLDFRDYNRLPEQEKEKISNSILNHLKQSPSTKNFPEAKLKQSVKDYLTTNEIRTQDTQRLANAGVSVVSSLTVGVLDKWFEKNGVELNPYVKVGTDVATIALTMGGAGAIKAGIKAVSSGGKIAYKIYEGEKVIDTVADLSKAKNIFVRTFQGAKVVKTAIQGTKLRVAGEVIKDIGKEIAGINLVEGVFNTVKNAGGAKQVVKTVAKNLPKNAPKIASAVATGAFQYRQIGDIGSKLGNIIIDNVKPEDLKGDTAKSAYAGVVGYKANEAFKNKDYEELASLRNLQNQINFSDDYKAITQAEGIGELWNALKEDKIGAVKNAFNVTLQSVVQQAPSIARGGVLAKSLGRLGYAIETGINSFSNEYSDKFLQVLTESGVDTDNADSIREAMTNPQLYNKARNIATKRGLAVSAFDVLSVAVAGRLFGKAGQNTLAKIVSGIQEAGIQGILGGAGEIAGAKINGDDISWGAVWGEVVGELVTGIPEIAIGSKQTHADIVERQKNNFNTFSDDGKIALAGILISVSPNFAKETGAFDVITNADKIDETYLDIDVSKYVKNDEKKNKQIIKDLSYKVIDGNATESEVKTLLGLSDFVNTQRQNADNTVTEQPVVTSEPTVTEQPVTNAPELTKEVNQDTNVAENATDNLNVPKTEDIQAIESFIETLEPNDKDDLLEQVNEVFADTIQAKNLQDFVDDAVDAKVADQIEDFEDPSNMIPMKNYDLKKKEWVKSNLDFTTAKRVAIVSKGREFEYKGVKLQNLNPKDFGNDTLFLDDLDAEDYFNFLNSKFNFNSDIKDLKIENLDDDNKLTYSARLGSDTLKFGFVLSEYTDENIKNINKISEYYNNNLTNEPFFILNNETEVSKETVAADEEDLILPEDTEEPQFDISRNMIWNYYNTNKNNKFLDKDEFQKYVNELIAVRVMNSVDKDLGITLEKLKQLYKQVVLIEKLDESIFDVNTAIPILQEIAKDNGVRITDNVSEQVTSQQPILKKIKINKDSFIKALVDIKNINKKSEKDFFNNVLIGTDNGSLLIRWTDAGILYQKRIPNFKQKGFKASINTKELNKILQSVKNQKTDNIELTNNEVINGDFKYAFKGLTRGETISLYNVISSLRDRTIGDKTNKTSLNKEWFNNVFTASDNGVTVLEYKDNKLNIYYATNAEDIDGRVFVGSHDINYDYNNSTIIINTDLLGKIFKNLNSNITLEFNKHVMFYNADDINTTYITTAKIEYGNTKPINQPELTKETIVEQTTSKVPQAQIEQPKNNIVIKSKENITKSILDKSEFVLEDKQPLLDLYKEYNIKPTEANIKSINETVKFAYNKQGQLVGLNADGKQVKTISTLNTLINKINRDNVDRFKDSDGNWDIWTVKDEAKGIKGGELDYKKMQNIIKSLGYDNEVADYFTDENFGDNFDAVMEYVLKNDLDNETMQDYLGQLYNGIVPLMKRDENVDDFIAKFKPIKETFNRSKMPTIVQDLYYAKTPDGYAGYLEKSAELSEHIKQMVSLNYRTLANDIQSLTPSKFARIINERKSMNYGAYVTSKTLEARVKRDNINNPHVIAHEVGHLLYQGLELRDKLQDYKMLLSNYGDNRILGDFSSWQDGDSLDNKLSEGFAEWFRNYLLNPNMDKTDMEQVFLNILKDKKLLESMGAKNIISKIKAIQDKYSKYQNMSDNQKKLETMVDNNNKIINKPSDIYSKGDIFNIQFIDYLAPIRITLEYLNKKNGNVSSNAYWLARNSAGSAGVAQDIVSKMIKIFNKSGSKPGHMEEFIQYMIDRRMRYLYENNPNYMSNLTQEERQKAIDDLNTTIDERNANRPNFEETANEFYKFWDDFVKEYEADFMPESLKNAISEKDNYVPMQVLFETILGENNRISTESNQKGFANLQKKYKFIRGGSGNALLSWDTVLVERIYASTKRKMKNDALKAFMNDVSGKKLSGQFLSLVKPLKFDDINSLDTLISARNIISNFADMDLTKIESENNIDYSELLVRIANVVFDNKKSANSKIIKEILTQVAEINRVSKDFKLLKDVNNIADVVLGIADGTYDFTRINKPKFVDTSLAMQRIISVMDNGEPKFYQVTEPYLYEALTMEPRPIGKLEKILSSYTSIRRDWITSNPSFAVFNAIRDSMQLSAISEGKFIPIYSIFNGLYKIVKGDKDYQDWVKNGGKLASVDVVSAQNKLKYTTIDSHSENKFKSLIKNYLIEPALNLREMSENSNRVYNFSVLRKYYLDNGYDYDTATTKAVFESRDILDWAMKGKNDLFNSYVATSAFMRSWINSNAKIIREIKTKPNVRKKIFINGVSVLTTSALMEPLYYGVYLANSDDDKDREIAEQYKMIPQYQKDNFQLVYLGGKWCKIPYPFEIGKAFATIPKRALLYIINSNPESVKQNVYEVLLSFGRSSYLPDIATDYNNVSKNKDDFTGAEISPFYTTGGKGITNPEYRYKRRTTNWTRDLVQAVNPIIRNLTSSEGIPASNIDYLIARNTGKLGTSANYLIDKAYTAIYNNITGEDRKATVEELGFNTLYNPSSNLVVSDNLYSPYYTKFTNAYEQAIKDKNDLSKRVSEAEYLGEEYTYTPKDDKIENKKADFDAINENIMFYTNNYYDPTLKDVKNDYKKKISFQSALILNDYGIVKLSDVNKKHMEEFLNKPLKGE